MMYIEDYLHVLVDNHMSPLDSDLHILASISKQVKKGVALTDRQYNLIVQKILLYRDRFESFNESSLLNVRLPLRSIDRSKYITLADTAEVYKATPYESYKSKWKWIKVRFPFSKKLISSLQETISKYSKIYFHKNGSHTHYFKLTETTLIDVVEIFDDKNFTIDAEILETYNTLKLLQKERDSIVPMYKDNAYRNLSKEALSFIKNELGTIENINVYKVYDRRFRYGCQEIDLTIPNSSLTSKIAIRTKTDCHIDSKSVTIDNVVGSLLELDRFPLLVVVDEADALEQIQMFYKSICNVVSPEEQIILFRSDTSNDYTVNDFIVDRKINNWLDSNIKIAYITNKKLPKLLLKGTWKPLACLTFTNVVMRHQLVNYCKDVSDLNIYYDEAPLRQNKNGYNIAL